MQMSKLIWKPLFMKLAEIPQADLRAILETHFVHAYYEEGRSVKYFNDHGSALTLQYTRKGKVELRPDNGLQASDIEALVDLLNNVCETPEAHIVSFIAMSSLPVRGYWEYRDQLQIVPVPPGAPLPRQEIADWPFIVTARYECPPVDVLRMNRRTDVLGELNIVLPVLLRGPKFSLSTFRPTKQWVIRKVSPSEYETTYSQSGYIAPNLKLASNTPVDTTHIPQAASYSESDYFSRRGRRPGDEFQVWTHTENVFDAYYGLSPAERHMFRSACYWYNIGRTLWGSSYSASYLALAIAIETLAEPSLSHICSECNRQHHVGIGKGFAAFLQRYASPQLDQRFYELRSRLIHGEHILHQDIFPGLFDFFPDSINEEDMHAELSTICRIALVNWLLRRALNQTTNIAT